MGWKEWVLKSRSFNMMSLVYHTPYCITPLLSPPDLSCPQSLPPSPPFPSPLCETPLSLPLHIWFTKGNDQDEDADDGNFKKMTPHDLADVVHRKNRHRWWEIGCGGGSGIESLLWHVMSREAVGNMFVWGGGGEVGSMRRRVGGKGRLGDDGLVWLEDALELCR